MSSRQAGQSSPPSTAYALAPSDAGRPEPEWTIVDSRSLRPSLKTLAELWRFREVLVAFVQRSVRVKYKQAFIGVGWAVIQPILVAALFAFLLTRVARLTSDGTPFFAFALTGMVVWTYFAGALSGGMESVVNEAHLMRKVYFPRELLPLAAVLAAVVDLIPAVVVMLIVTVICGITPAVSWLLLPLPLAVLPIAAFAFAVAPSALNVFYRDLRYVVPFVLQLGLFASPIFWSLSQVSQPWRDIVAIANPAAAVIDSVRRIVLHGQGPQWLILGATVLWCLVVLVVGLTVFKRLERQFVDRV